MTQNRFLVRGTARNHRFAPKKFCLVCVATAGELFIQLSRFLCSCIGLTSTSSLRPCMNQSDKWLLIYGREKSKLVVASKTTLLLFSGNVKIKRNVSSAVLNFSLNFKGLAVLSIPERAPSTFYKIW